MQTISAPINFTGLAGDPNLEAFDGGYVEPYIPLSPYMIQNYVDIDNYLVPLETAALSGNECFMPDQNREILNSVVDWPNNDTNKS